MKTKLAKQEKELNHFKDVKSEKGGQPPLVKRNSEVRNSRARQDLK